MNFNDLGVSTVKDSTAFKKIQYFSKTNPQSLFNDVSDFNMKYKKIANLYMNDSLPSNSSSYGTLRQHNYSSLMATTNSFNSLLDSSSLNKFLEYNNDFNVSKKFNTIDSTSNNNTRLENINTNSNNLRILNLTNVFTNKKNQDLSKLVNYTVLTSFINSETDSKQITNPFRYLFSNKFPKKVFLNNNYVFDKSMNSSKLFNLSNVYRFKDLKSSNQQFLTSDRNTRLIQNLNPKSTKLNFTNKDNNLNSIVFKSMLNSLTNPQYNLFTNSSLS